MRILQISCGYFPDSVGGTEEYVHNLSRQLISRGHQVFIHYARGFSEASGPPARAREFIFQGLPVHVIEKNTFASKTAQLYFNTQQENDSLFEDYLKNIRPDLVHFHHFSPTDVISQMRVAKDMNLPVLLTYHTPMMTCGHADLLYLGREVCNGKIEYKRCLICAQTKYGIPYWLAYIWAILPDGLMRRLGESVSKLNLKGPLATWLELPWLTKRRIEAWKNEFGMIDHFVAVCQWVSDLLTANGIIESKITLSRQGIDLAQKADRGEYDGTLRLGYLGRIHPVKGLDVLLGAMKLIPPESKIELSIYGYCQGQGDDKYYQKQIKDIKKDKRIKLLGILRDEDKVAALGQLDALVIPSRWLESGPLVQLEAWAIGLAVIGADLGGILELAIENKGVLLFKAGDARSLADIIMRIYHDPALLKNLKASIPKVRTVQEVADDMEGLYSSLLNNRRG